MTISGKSEIMQLFVLMQDSFCKMILPEEFLSTILFFYIIYEKVACEPQINVYFVISLNVQFGLDIV